MKRYLNIKTNQGVETIDEINSKDFKTFKGFRIEKNKLIKEYKIASPYYNSIYYSQRCSKDWN